MNIPKICKTCEHRKCHVESMPCRICVNNPDITEAEKISKKLTSKWRLQPTARLICPTCSSKSIKSEKRLDGMAECLKCGYYAKVTMFHRKLFKNE